MILVKATQPTTTSILHLTLTRQWFDQIAAGTKTKDADGNMMEFREDKPYWRTRLCSSAIARLAGQELRKFTEVHFRNGYAKGAPFMRVEFKFTDIGPGLYGPNCFRIHLGNVLEKRNCKPCHADVLLEIANTP